MVGRRFVSFSKWFLFRCYVPFLGVFFTSFLFPNVLIGVKVPFISGRGPPCTKGKHWLPFIDETLDDLDDFWQHCPSHRFHHSCLKESDRQGARVGPMAPRLAMGPRGWGRMMGSPGRVRGGFALSVGLLVLILLLILIILSHGFGHLCVQAISRYIKQCCWHLVSYILDGWTSQKK